MIHTYPLANHFKADRSFDNCIIVSILSFIRQLHEQFASVSSILVRKIEYGIKNGIKYFVQLLSAFWIEWIGVIKNGRTATTTRFLG